MRGGIQGRRTGSEGTGSTKQKGFNRKELKELKEGGFLFEEDGRENRCTLTGFSGPPVARFIALYPQPYLVNAELT